MSLATPPIIPYSTTATPRKQFVPFTVFAPETKASPIIELVSHGSPISPPIELVNFKEQIPITTPTSSPSLDLYLHYKCKDNSYILSEDHQQCHQLREPKNLKVTK